MSAIAGPASGADGAPRAGRLRLPSSRRGVLLAVAALTAVAVLVWRATDDDGPVERDVAAVGVGPVHHVRSARLGMTFSYPTRWDRRPNRRDVIRLISPNRTVAVTIDSPIRGIRSRRVVEDTARRLIRAYRSPRVLRRERVAIGGRSARSVEIAATNRRGQRLRVLAAATVARDRTYSVGVFTAVRADARSVAEAKLILDSIRFVSRR